MPLFDKQPWELSPRPDPEFRLCAGARRISANFTVLCGLVGLLVPRLTVATSHWGCEGVQPPFDLVPLQTSKIFCAGAVQILAGKTMMLPSIGGLLG